MELLFLGPADVAGSQLHRLAIFMPHIGVIKTDGDPGNIIVVRTKAQRHRCVRGNRTKR